MLNDYRRYIGLLSVIVAGALLVVALADGGLRVKKLLDGPDAAGQSAGNQSAKPIKTASYRVRDITGVHLFGHESKKSTPAPREVKASKTTLKLDLLGVVASVDPDLARALISPNNRKIKSYAIGEVIESTDAKLFAVDSDKVTLERNGKYETLSMERRSIGDPRVERPASARSSGTSTKSSKKTIPTARNRAARTSTSARRQWRSRFSKRRPPTAEDFRQKSPEENSTATSPIAKDSPANGGKPTAENSAKPD